MDQLDLTRTRLPAGKFTDPLVTLMLPPALGGRARQFGGLASTESNSRINSVLV